MVPSLVKCIPAMLFVGLISFVSSSEKVAIDCEKFAKHDEPCPSYCPKEFRPNSLNPKNLWGVPCVCCSSNKQAEDGISSEPPNAFLPNMVVHESSPNDVPLEARTKLLNKLQKLKELKKLPPKESDFWESRVQLTEDDLLSPDEVELLISLLVDCGVSWTAAFFLVHPLAAEQSQPAQKTFGMRSVFGLLTPEKTFSLSDLQDQLKDVVVSKVTGTVEKVRDVFNDKKDDGTKEEDGTA